MEQVKSKVATIGGESQRGLNVTHADFWKKELLRVHSELSLVEPGENGERRIGKVVVPHILSEEQISLLDGDTD